MKKIDNLEEYIKELDAKIAKIDEEEKNNKNKTGKNYVKNPELDSEAIALEKALKKSLKNTDNLEEFIKELDAKIAKIEEEEKNNK